jgi:Raf kinase inhibitor-like YbhB/YbcL family protein
MFKFIIIFGFMVAIHSSASSQAKSLVVTSKSFANNASMPMKYSCEGEQVSPPLQVSNLPAGTKTLALIMHDPDAPLSGGFTHWVVWNIEPPGIMPENYKGAEQGLNGAGKAGYIGMCPPSGTHHYHFMVYALDSKLDLDKSTDKAGLEKAVNGHVLAEGELVGLYKKQKD